MSSIIICQIAFSVSLVLAIISFKKVRNSRDKFEFIYGWGIFYGAFVWEDLLVFSTTAAVLAAVVFIFKDLRIGILSLIVFWIIRSAGETLYFFLQQFIQPKHSPHEISGHFLTAKPLLGDLNSQKHFIIMQVVWQSVMTMSAVILVLILIHWGQLPVWF